MTKIAVGSPVPDFKLPELSGGQKSLSEALKKGPVALAFFKVSCPVCQYTFPFLERIHKAYEKEGVAIWGISQDDARDTKEYAEEYETTFPMLLDGDGYPVSNEFGITNVPTVILVGKDGKATVSDHGFNKKALEAVSTQFATHIGKPQAAIFRPGESVPDYKPG
ncbi:MAG: TlpA family protein disulfide reductase [Acidobacteria bacterium]|nr:TlpA family protein disulfide reductase [Acidobacteriota bacterium]